MAGRVDLSVSVCGLRLANPVMLGSGPLGVTGEQLVGFGQVAGAVVTKSISERPSAGSPQPRIVSIDHDGMLNYEGGPNPGIEAFARIMREAKPRMRCPLIGSMSARTLRLQKGMERLAARFEEAGADAIELDFKYLYDKGSARTDFTRQQIDEAIGGLKKVVSLPLIAKLAFGPTEIALVAKAAEEAGAAAVTAINTVFPGMKINVRRRAPVLSMHFGGLSGAPVRPLAVAAVFQIAKEIRIPVIGCGGIMTGEDVLEFFLAGASAVQIFTVAMAEKEAAFTRIVGELEAACEKYGIARLADVVGAAQNAVVTEKADLQWAAFSDD
ncbi:MAG: hypothetical protein HY521_06775 [Proteobacteria bacterium]|nr:hypothetical protein [Pseudomonadota bacterium]